MVENVKMKLGFAPTRRNVFSREDALKYKRLIRGKLGNMGVDFVDLDWLNEDGLLYDAAEADKAAKVFTQNGVDAVFSPHCNFGTEDAVAKLAKKMGKPFLLWGPRDESPTPEGTRLRDSQCGLFATSKVLRRLGVPFTYIENCRLDTPIFEDGVKNFIAAASVVKAFRGMRIGQIDTRPQAFWTVMVNEGELLEKFGIEVVPIALSDLESMMKDIEKDQDFIKNETVRIKKKVSCTGVKDEYLDKMVAMKQAIKHWALNEGLSAVAIQCWNALQDVTGVMPCYVNSELTEESIPVVCETDIHGAISAVIAQAAMMYKTPVFFSDITIRHPDNDNAELLWHCGPFPFSLKKEGETGRISEHYVLHSQCPGVAEWEIRGGEISICRFDGDNGCYSMFAAEGKGVDGPKTRGTYVWVEFENWPEIERKLITGPYIHLVAGIHGRIKPVLLEGGIKHQHRHQHRYQHLLLHQHRHKHLHQQLCLIVLVDP